LMNIYDRKRNLFEFDGDGRINCFGRSMNALRQLSFVIVDRLIDDDNNT